MRIALFQPDIALNVGAILRLGACMGVPVSIIEPCGFPFSVAAVRRSAMDYLAHAAIDHHASFGNFMAERPFGRLVLFTTQAQVSYHQFAFAPDDCLLFGRESAGVPDDVHARANARLLIPLRAGMRSINVAQAAAMAMGEALRQTNQFPTAT